MSNLIDSYNKKINHKDIEFNHAQKNLIIRLNELSNNIYHYKQYLNRTGLLRKLLKLNLKKELIPKGLFIHGDVGRGKTMLVNLFYDELMIIRKKQEHFHAFMLNIHKKIKEWRDKHHDDQNMRDPIIHVANNIAKKYKVICLDELQILDITDAMIVYRLFNQLYKQGVVTVITSNRAPHELYKDGLQREHFLPFIDLLKQKNDIYDIDTDKDYRLDRLKAIDSVYFFPNNKENEKKMNDIFHDFAGANLIKPTTLDVMGRKLKLSNTAGSVVMCSFCEICSNALGAADYIEIAETFSVIIMQNIPRLSPENRDEAKRFITFIDEIYRHNVKFICSAETIIEELYIEGTGKFEFLRTISRLHEMQSDEYLAREHKLCSGEIRE